MMLLFVTLASVIAFSDPRFAWIAAIERDGGTHALNAGEYLLDRQYILPPGTVIIGVGPTTVLRAVPTKPAHKGGLYHGCGTNAVNRVGLVLGPQTHVANLHYVGFDTGRFPDSHPLCGGAPFETPGCATAYCSDTTATGGALYGAGGVANVLLENITVAGGTVQNVFWMPMTRETTCSNITVRRLTVLGNCTRGGNETPGPCPGSGTWADGINVHGAHHGILIEGNTVEHSGDDAFAMWSGGSNETDVVFRNNSARMPRYPRSWLASCFAVYGGNDSAFVNNRCVGTGERGMIAFLGGFQSAYAPGASSDVHGNWQDARNKPLCGGMAFPNKVVNAPGCVP
eukprot:m.152638 g.152638  ORF g.152638 m.152638 type:complete len:342 (-) comp15055_c0_seq17:1655-2680(-)